MAEELKTRISCAVLGSALGSWIVGFERDGYRADFLEWVLLAIFLAALVLALKGGTRQVSPPGSSCTRMGEPTGATPRSVAEPPFENNRRQR